MTQNERTRELLAMHCQRYPKLQIQDIFKYIYQSSFGCEHMISSLDTAAGRIEEEEKSITSMRYDYFDDLDGEYIRFHMNCPELRLASATLGKLFFTSARKEDGQSKLLQMLAVTRELVREGVLPFSSDELEAAIKQWEADGFAPVHHSQEFRREYNPSYRVISRRYEKFLPLFAAIDESMAKKQTVVAIDGKSASGKTTLGEILRNIYDCTIFHLDDYFLRPEQRTKERYAQVGGNIDKERFSEEILRPLAYGENIRYQRFDCATFTLCPPVDVKPSRLVVIEGVYSLHEEFGKYCDLGVFLDISDSLQRERIIARNGDFAHRFFTEWIPLENLYFEKMRVKERCDLIIDSK